MSTPHGDRCEQSEVTCAYAAQALAASEVAAAEAHIASCPECQRELESLRPVVDRFVSWPTDVLRPTTSLQARLARRIAEETGKNQCCRRRARETKLGPTRNGNRSACWYASHRARVTRRIPMRAQKSCIFSTVSCGSMSASSFRATTTTVRRERATSASGARPAAPVFSSPVPKTFCAEA